MTFESNAQLGQGGAGMSGQGPGSMAAIAKELQGFTVSLLAGAAANTLIPLAAIKTEDTIAAALNNSAGTLTDITGTVTIAGGKATGTITVGTAAAGDTVTVAGLVYTLVAANATVLPTELNKFKIGADANGTAANLAAAINAREANRTQQVSAAAATNVVTVTAFVEGTGGNSLTLTEVGNSFTVSGAGTLTGGAASGGIKSSGATTQVVLFWFNKK
jgi:hypothetical protein